MLETASFEHNRVLIERIPAWRSKNDSNEWKKKTKSANQNHTHLTSNLHEHLTKIRETYCDASKTIN